MPGKNQIAALAVMGLAFAGCVAPELRDPAAFHARFGATAPRANVVSICHAYECRRITRVALHDLDIQNLRSIMRPGDKTPAEERAAAANAIAWLERRVAPQVGTASDRGYEDFASANDPSQTDCIDEAANATSYLLVLQENGLLRHHRVLGPATRGFVHGRMLHTTAVLKDVTADRNYALDSWIRANGRPAVVAPLDVWYKLSYRDLDLQG